jgi:hypothetical protein
MVNVPIEEAIRKRQDSGFTWNVPVKDENLSTFRPKVLLTNSRCDADVIEEAKTHSLGYFCMVSRWTDHSNSIFDLPFHNSSTCFNGTSCR